MKLSVQFGTPHLGVRFGTPSLGISTGDLIIRDAVQLPPYTGDYTITPSSESQVLQTENLRMTDNVVINPIPSNYGLITWNGSTITVS